MRMILFLILRDLGAAVLAVGGWLYWTGKRGARRHRPSPPDKSGGRILPKPPEPDQKG